MSSPLSSEWKETSPGHFERPFDSIEFFFRSLGELGTPLGKEHWSVTFGAQFHLDLPTDEAEHALRNAWTTMRHDHPEIASFAQGNTKVYEVPNETSLKTWLAETFIVESATTTKERLYETFGLPRLATCHYLPHSSEIVIHTSHWRMDGVGSLHFLRNFFLALITPRQVVFGNEGRNLTPGLDEIAGFAAEAKSPEDDQASTELMLKYFANLPTIGFPTNDTPIPGPTHRTELVLGPKTTAAIVAGCKASNLTVASAMHAASILATRELDTTSPANTNYTSFRPVNYRPFLPAPYNDPNINPVSVVILGLPITFVPTTFAEVSKETQISYKQPLALTETKFQSMMAPYVKKFAATATMPPPPGAPQPSDPMLNSVGVVDNFLDSKYGDKLEITSFWLGVEMLTKQLNLYVWTWQEKMVFSGCFNSAFYGDEFTVGIYKKVVGILAKELDLKIGEDWSL
ncbi:hypothetical protein N431DRAFT_450159 [Stipitochalara longipes BDJ]|nr:hypothetical protein N431DRAFT_450159 [Stipitochalara longipes BDJ]